MRGACEGVAVHVADEVVVVEASILGKGGAFGLSWGRGGAPVLRAAIHFTLLEIMVPAWVNFTCISVVLQVCIFVNVVAMMETSTFSILVGLLGSRNCSTTTLRPNCSSNIQVHWMMAKGVGGDGSELKEELFEP